MLANRQKRENDLQVFFDRMRKQKLAELRMQAKGKPGHRKILRKVSDRENPLTLRMVNLAPENDFGVKFEEELRIKGEVQSVLQKLSREGSMSQKLSPRLLGETKLPYLSGHQVKAASKSPVTNRQQQPDRHHTESDRDGWDSWRQKLQLPDRSKLVVLRIPKIRPYKTKSPPGNPTSTDPETDNRYFEEVLRKRHVNLALERRAALGKLSRPSLAVDTRKPRGGLTSVSQEVVRTAPRDQTDNPTSHSVDFDDYSKESIDAREPSSPAKDTTISQTIIDSVKLSKRQMFHKYIDDLHRNTLTVHQERGEEYQHLESHSKETYGTKSTRSRELFVTSKLNIHGDPRLTEVMHDYSFRRVSPRGPVLQNKVRNLQERAQKRSQGLIDSSSEIQIHAHDAHNQTQVDARQTGFRVKKQHAALDLERNEFGGSLERLDRSNKLARHERYERAAKLDRLDKSDRIDNSSADNIHQKSGVKKVSPKLSSKDYLNITLNSWRVGTPPDLDSPR